MSSSALQAIPDDELLRRLAELLQQSRRVESELVAHIGEVDERRLYAREACSSMFSYATEVLHLSEAEAYMRIGVARASRRYPLILAMLADGRLHLSGAAKLVPHLSNENCDALLERATHKTKRQIEELVAELSPKPDVPPIIRKLPSPPAPPVQLRPDAVKFEIPEVVAPPVEASRPPPPPVVMPLAPARYKVQFTASASFRDKLERLQGLMGEDLAAVIESAVTEKLERLESKRYRAHNRFFAERDYGSSLMKRYRRGESRVRDERPMYGSTGPRNTFRDRLPACRRA